MTYQLLVVYNRPMNTLIMDAVEAAGGTIIVAKALNRTPEAVRKWRDGLPRTEWTGETNYLLQIETLQTDLLGKVKYTADEIKAAQIWN